MTVAKDPTFVSSEPQKERREWTKIVFKELMSENIPNLMKYKNLQIQESDQTPNKANSNKSTSKYTSEN